MFLGLMVSPHPTDLLVVFWDTARRLQNAAIEKGGNAHCGNEGAHREIFVELARLRRVLCDVVVALCGEVNN